MSQGPIPTVPFMEGKPSKTYNGGCHCGAVKYAVTISPPLDDPTQVVTACNCSICATNGYLLILSPNSSIEFSRGGEKDLTVSANNVYFNQLSRVVWK
jgi:hypothetical protein